MRIYLLSRGKMLKAIWKQFSSHSLSSVTAPVLILYPRERKPPAIISSASEHLLLRAQLAQGKTKVQKNGVIHERRSAGVPQSSSLR